MPRSQTLSLRKRLFSVFAGLLFIAGALGKENTDDDPADFPQSTIPRDTESEYLIDVWGTDEGLPRNVVTSIVQTPDGYLWCGTYDGMVRFDGIRFVRIGPDNPANPQANRVLSLYYDRRGNLWLGTDGGGLLRFANGEFTTFAEPRVATLNTVRSIAEDASGDLWLGTKGGLGRWRDGKIAWFTEANGFTNTAKSIWNITFDREGKLWIADWTNLKLFQNGQFETINVLPDFRPPLRAVYSTDNGGLYSGMLGHAMRLGSDGQWSSVADGERFSNSEVMAFCKTRSGELWVGTRRGLYLQREGGWTLFTERDGLGSSEVRVLFEDNEGNLWVGTGTGGLARLKRRVVKTFAARHGLSDDRILALRESPSGGLWVGMNNGKLAYGKAGDFHVFDKLVFPSDAAVNSVLPTRDGALWVGTFGNGLVRYHHGEKTSFIPSEGTPARTDKITALLEDRKGNVWVGTFYALYQVAGTNLLVPVPVGGKEGRAHVTALLEDREGGIWVGYHGLGAVHLYQNKTFWLTRREGLPTDLIRTLHQDDSGTVWIGTSAGLCMWRQGKIHAFTRKHGLVDHTISQILEDDSDNLWLGSNRGIMRVSKNEFYAVSEGRKPSLDVFACGRGEGMLSQECSGGFYPSGLKTRDGKLWFPTAKGLVMVDPVHLKLRMNPQPPPVHIEEIWADGKLLRQSSAFPAVKTNHHFGMKGPVLLNPNTRRLEFIFTGLSLTAPERLRFKYQLEGIDPDWVEIGNSRSATFPNLQPGDYKFRVIAGNHAGVWNQAGAVVGFTVLPFFWQTWWFRTTSLAAFTLCVIGIVRYLSFRRLRRHMLHLEEQAALHKERARIAKDIHDDLGANLTQIALLGDLAQQDRDAPEKAGERIARISSTARQAIKSLDEIVWAVNPRNDTLAHLIDYAGQFAVDYLRVAGIRCRLDLPEQIPSREISTDIRHNLFLVIKEALNNIVKHARATEVWLRVNACDQALLIEIQDNGCGFENAREASGADGLPNMRQRATEIGGECSIESHDGTGTRIRIQLPWPRG